MLCLYVNPKQTCAAMIDMPRQSFGMWTGRIGHRKGAEDAQ